jgi:TolB protein
VQDTLKTAIDAARRGDKQTAQRLLNQVVLAEPTNEIALMWLASVTDNLQERRAVLERVLRMNPNNTRARQAYEQLSSAMGLPTRVASGRSAPARPAPQPARANTTGYIVLGMLLLVGVVGVLLFRSALQQPEPPNQATTAALFNTPTPSDTPDPASFTATPFYGVFVAAPSSAPTLPPTFTATFTFTPQPTATGTATPYPLSAFTLLYTIQSEGQEQPSLVRSRGDGSEMQTFSGGFADVAFDPSGTKIAFVRVLTYTGPNGSEVTAPELFVAPAANPAAAQQITQIGSPLLASPAWAPDGIRIVFVSDYGGDLNLWTITDDGNNLRGLTDTEGADKDPSWSPDGERIVFASERSGRAGSGVTQIFSITTDGETVQQLTVSGNSSYAPVWSPDGRRIAFASDRNGDGDIFIMDADGQQTFLLTVDDRGAEDRRPSFTPTGQEVAFISNRGGGTFQVYTVDLQGRTVQTVTSAAANVTSAAFKPEPLLIIQRQP